MANEKRVRNNNVQGTLSSTMNSTGTSMNSAGLANLEAISSTEHAAIIIDPGRTAGAPEIVWVTAHTGSATSATIARGKEGTAARAHSSTEDWVHAPTAAIDYLPFRPPSAGVRRDAAQSIANNTWTAIQFDTEVWDTDTIWSSTASNKLKIRTPGKYLITFASGIANSSGGSVRGIGIAQNTTRLSAGTETGVTDERGFDPLNANMKLSISAVLPLTTSDYVTLQLFQNSGGAVNASTNVLNQPYGSIVWMSS